MAHYTSHRENKERKFIDIHSHIIFDVDDGSDSFIESMEMLAMSYKEGIVGIIATPHYGILNPNYDHNKVVKNINILNEKLKELKINMKIFLGNELYWKPGMIEELNSGQALTMAGTSYVLVEFNVESRYEYIEDAVRRLVAGGYRPIIAHYERYVNLVNDIEMAQELIDAGAYIQINARSFIKGKRDRRFSWVKDLLLNDMIHLIGTDAHNTDRRRPIMRAAVDVIVKLAGEESADRITRINIMKLLKNSFI